MRIESKMALLITLIVSFSQVPAEPRSVSPDLSSVIQNSDLIVVGSVVESAIEAHAGALDERIVVVVDQVLKGNSIQEKNQISIDVGDPEDGASLATGQYGMFFLKETTTWGYQATDRNHPMLPVIPGRPKLFGATVTDRVVAELAAALDSEGNSTQIPLFYEGAAIALQSLPYSISSPYLKSLSTSSRAMTRLWAVACMINQLDFSSLNLVEYELTEPNEENAPAVTFVALAIESHVAPNSAISELSRFLKSENVEVRRAVAHNLREIGSVAVIEPLANAINDPDRDVRYFAVGGLENANGGNVPAMTDYSLREKAYLDKWHTWIGQHHSKAGVLVSTKINRE